MIQGKQFEIDVAELLRLRGHKVRKEELIGSKKVDLVAEQEVFGKLHRYSVECKDYKAVLSRNETKKIYADYLEPTFRTSLTSNFLFFHEHFKTFFSCCAYSYLAVFSSTIRLSILSSSA